jgi:hypothetical protein
MVCAEAMAAASTTRKKSIPSSCSIFRSIINQSSRFIKMNETACEYRLLEGILIMIDSPLFFKARPAMPGLFCNGAAPFRVMYKRRET